MTQKIIEEIFENEKYVLDHFSQWEYFTRSYDEKNIWDIKLLWVVWLRWVWKSSFLLHKRVQQKKSIYFSLDQWSLIQEDIFDIIKTLYKVYGIEFFYLDEIHSYGQWKSLLKNMAVDQNRHTFEYIKWWDN